jgi:hypothetical protein
MASAPGSFSSFLGEEGSSEYLREYQELILFAEQHSTSFEEVKRRVDEFYDQHIFHILRDYHRQFAFTLATLKVYSVFRAAAAGEFPVHDLPSQIIAASRVFPRGSCRRESGMYVIHVVGFSSNGYLENGDPRED